MDVADILGLNKTQQQQQEQQQDPLKLLENDNNNNNKNKLKDKDKNKIKPKGMSRELFALMGRDGITPSIQTNSQSNIFKDKRQQPMQGKWLWTPFKNSARNDDLQCSHWIKAELQGYDYTYAKFNVKIEPISYTDSEYDTLLQNSTWTRSETDHLMFLCYEYDLRWPVISDRYESSSQRSVEELMNRYYFIVSKLKSHRNGQGDFTSKNTSAESFNIDYERARRKQQDLLFRKTQAEEIEEAKIREELKSIDAQLKKLKKATTNLKPTITQSESSTAILPTRTNNIPRASTTNSTNAPPSSAATVLNPPIMMYGGGISSSTSSSSASSSSTTNNNNHGLFPSPGYPCLQSARLALHSEANQKYIHPDLSQSFTKKIINLLQELGVPDRLLPTKKICDLNDEIRKDAAILLSLQNTIQKKEKELQSLKVYHESNGKRKDNSFILPHIGLLLNEPDLQLSEYYLNPTLVPTTVTSAIPGISTITNAPSRSSNKGHGRKSSSSSSSTTTTTTAATTGTGASGGGINSTTIVNPLLGTTTTTTQSKPQKRKASVVSIVDSEALDYDGEHSEIVVPIVKVQAVKKSKKQPNPS